MITQLQVIRLIRQELPVMAEKEGVQISPTSFTSIQASIYFLSDCTRNALAHAHFGAARKCFKLAERLYLEGDVMVKLLIENVFVYANVSSKNVATGERRLLEKLIPETLYKIHLRQLMGSGC